MSTNSSDSDLCNSEEWTVVTHQEGEGSEQQTLVSVRRQRQEDSNNEDNSNEESKKEIDDGSIGNAEDQTQEKPPVWDASKGDQPDEDLMSNGSSDIAVLGEEEEEEREYKKQIGPEDAMSLSRVEDLRDDMSDISSLTSIQDELNSEVDFSPSRFRHYIHTPNSRINLTLTVVAVLTVTAVLGLGVGNFIGWSCVQRVSLPEALHQKSKPSPYIGAASQFSPDIVQLMRHLYRQIIFCNHHPGHKACLKDGEHWRQQFLELFEAKDGGRILKDLNTEAPKVEQGETPSQQQQLKDMEDKLLLLSRQLENLQVQKRKERQQEGHPGHNKPQPIKRHPPPSPAERNPKEDALYAALNEQVQQLKNQNQELNSMLKSLQDNGNSKKESEQINELRDQVVNAVKENQKLKEMVDSINVNRVVEARQQINDLQLENQDLRVEIGRLRYSQSKQQETTGKREPETMMPKEHRNKYEQDDLREQKNQYEPEPAPREQMKQSRENSAKGVFEKWPQVNWTELVNHLGSTGQGAKLGELGEALSQLLRDLWELNATLFPSEGAMTEEEVDENKEDALKEIETLLVSKWKELQGMVSLSKGYVSHHAEGMSRLLASSMSKVYKAGVKVLFGDPHKAAPVESGQPQLQKLMSKIGKVMISLEDKWSKMKKKLGTGQTEKIIVEEDLTVKEEEDDETTQWLFERARDREQNREVSRSKLYEDWYTRRAKNRRQQRHDQNDKPCKDPKRCKKTIKKQENTRPADSSSDDAWDGSELPKHTYKESRGY